MKALILCGGKGTRLRPLTYTRSKQLLPIANKPIVEYVLDHINLVGIKDVGIIIAPETSAEIKNYFDNCEVVKKNQIKITYITQDAPLGLAHAVKTARGFLKQDDFMMYLGDNLLKDDVVKQVKEFKKDKLDALVFLKEVEHPEAFGVAQLDAKGNIIHLVEKPKNPPSNLALVGVYLFSPKIHEAIDNIKPSWRNELEITDAIQKLIEMKGKVKGEKLQSWWLDTGKKDDILSANTIVLDEYVKGHIDGKVDKSSKITGRVNIGEGSQVTNSKVRGPAVIGKNVIITDSFIGPYSSIGDNSEIKNSNIEHCVILRGVKISGIARIEDSLIGEDTQVMKNLQNNNALKLMIGDSAIVEI